MFHSPNPPPVKIKTVNIAVNTDKLYWTLRQRQQHPPPSTHHRAMSKCPQQLSPADNAQSRRTYIGNLSDTRYLDHGKGNVLCCFSHSLLPDCSLSETYRPLT